MKTILITILAGLSVVLVGVSAYQRQNQPAEPMPVVVKQPVVNQPITTTSNETAGWKKYENVYAGYRVRYPSDWVIDSPKIYDDNNSQITFYSELFHPANKPGEGVAIAVSNFPSNLNGKLSLLGAVKMVTGITTGEQVKIGEFNALKVGQWPDLGMPNGAYFLLYPSGTLFNINYTIDYKSKTDIDGIQKIFESMASSLTFMPSQ